MWKIIFAVLSIPLMFVGNDCGGGPIKITEAWTHATPADATTAEVYLTIQNQSAADTLTTVTTYIAETTAIITTTEANGAREQKEVPNLTIEANKDTSLRKNRTFILLQKLKQPLKAGDKFPVTLKFDKAGDILEDVIVQPAGTITYGK
ncbi:MAG: copper chaperone PCu(A)C [Alphaproteobacteria bacterium]|nr:copper chaperone PCu(A)C [Alphaproteobacteria bacterium]